MSWPNSVDYNETIQDPSRCFADPDLKAGQVACNDMGLPKPCTGNFADVYEVSCPGGQIWAVKCFTREVADLQRRYEAISNHLTQAQKQGGLPFMVEFRYLAQGIRVRGQWYPILKMHWVKGDMLNVFVHKQLDRPKILTSLASLWLRLSRDLSAAGMAHGDLQHGNVLLVPGKQANTIAPKLIDYDGIFVPSLANSKASELGHPNFQHPRRKEAPFHLQVDDFSHLVIYTAIRCLAVAGRGLWDRYDNGDNLLFRETDFENPAKSPLFQELWKLKDSSAQALVGRLVLACLEPPKQTLPLKDVVNSDGSVSIETAEFEKVAKLLREGKPDVKPPPGASPAESGSQKKRSWQPVLPRSGPSPTGQPARLPAVPPAIPSWQAPSTPASTVHPQQTPAVCVVCGKSLGGASQCPHCGNNQHASNGNTVVAGVIAVVIGVAIAILVPGLLIYHQATHIPEETRRAEQNRRVEEERLVEQKRRAEEKRLAEEKRFAARLFVLKGDAAYPVAFSPDGKRIFTASYPAGDVQVWDAATGQEINFRKGHIMHHVAFSPDGKRILAASQDNPTTVWDAESGQEVFTLKDAGYVRSVAWSPDGKRLLTGAVGKATVWEAGTGQKVVSVEIGSNFVQRVAFNLDGNRILTKGDDGAAVWDAVTGTKIYSHHSHFSPWRSVSVVPHLSFSPDGKCFVVHYQGEHVLAGDAANYRHIEPWVKVWDAATGKELSTLVGLKDVVKGAPVVKMGIPTFRSAVNGWSPDSKRIVTTTDYYERDKPSETAVWEAATGQKVCSLDGSIYGCVSFSPDSKRLLARLNRGEARMWNAETGQKMLTLEGVSACFSPDGKRILIHNAGWEVWDAQAINDSPR